MALPPMNVTEEVFAREVDEELQRDQMLGLWQRYGKPAVWSIIGLLALWAAWLYWGHRQELAYGLEGEKFSAITESLTKGADPKANEKLQEIIKADAEGFHAPANLIAGGLASEKNDLKKAAENFGKAANDESAAQPWRELGLLRQTAADFDTLKPDVVISRLKPLAVAGKPWFGSAGEMMAIAYLKLNKKDLAGRMFADLAKDEKVPETIRNRSSEMAISLGIDATVPVKPNLAQPAQEGK